MRKWGKQTLEAPFRQTSPPVFGLSPIGGVELGKEEAVRGRMCRTCLTLYFMYPYLFSSKGPRSYCRKRLQTDATWHDLKILTEPLGWSRYEKGLWNARSID